MNLKVKTDQPIKKTETKNDNKKNDKLKDHPLLNPPPEKKGLNLSTVFRYVNEREDLSDQQKVDLLERFV